MSPDEQEARSRLHTGFWVVPLSSGRLAVWSHPMGQQIGVFDTLSQAAEAVPAWRKTAAGHQLQLRLTQSTARLELDMTGIDL